MMSVVYVTIFFTIQLCSSSLIHSTSYPYSSNPFLAQVFNWTAFNPSIPIASTTTNNNNQINFNGNQQEPVGGTNIFSNQGLTNAQMGSSSAVPSSNNVIKNSTALHIVASLGVNTPIPDVSHFTPMQSSIYQYNPSGSTLTPVTETLAAFQPQFLTQKELGLRSRCLQSRGQFPSDKCNTFVNCWDDDVKEQLCPPGLVFSSKGYCDYADNVDCNGLPIIQDVVTNTSPSVTVTVTNFAQAGVVTQPPVSSLPPQQPGLAIVNEPVGVIAAPLSVVDLALKQKCLKPRGQFPTDACNKYINCWDDSVKEEECPPGMAFSQKGYCDFDYNVNCVNRIYERKPTADSNCPAPHGTFRDKTNCSLYYTCMFNKIVANYQCPSELKYNDVLGVCDYAYRVDCNHEPLIYPPTKLNLVLHEVPAGTSESPTTTTCTPGSIYRLNPQCTSAVLCRYGITEIVECPSGLAYDSVTDKCLMPHLAKC